MLCADLGSNCLADTWFSSFYFVSFWSTNPQEKTGKDTGSIVSSQPTLYLLGEGIRKRYHPWIQHELALSRNHTEKTKRDPEWQIAEGPEGYSEGAVYSRAEVSPRAPETVFVLQLPHSQQHLLEKASLSKLFLLTGFLWLLNAGWPAYLPTHPELCSYSLCWTTWHICLLYLVPWKSQSLLSV